MSRLAPVPLPAREAYRLWAPSYGAETAVSALEEVGVARLPAPLAGRKLLDAGCGTGRRLARAGAAGRVGADAAREMLTAGRDAGVMGYPLVCADVRALPFAEGSFDAAWCRLVLGHLSDPAGAYRELGRVCRTGSWLVVTDFHAEAAQAGHARTFRDATGRLRAVEHHVHTAAAHVRAAEAAGWAVAAQLDLAVGPEIRRFYEEAGRLDAFEAQQGLPLVLALCFGR